MENTFDSLKAAQNATRIRAELEGDNSLAYAEALSRQAEAYAARSQTHDALVSSNKAVGIAEALPEIETLQLIKLKWTATLVRCNKHTLDDAEQACREVLNLLAQLQGGENHYLFIRSQALLGDIYRLMGIHMGQQAFDCYQQAIERSERLWGADNAWTLAFLDAQILLCRKLRDYEKADEISSQRELYAQSSDFESTYDAIASLNNVGVDLLRKGKYGKAEPILYHALEMLKRLLGAEHLDVALSLNNLAGLYANQGRYSDAEPLHQEALEMLKRLLGAEHLDVASSLNNLAGIYANQGRYSDAKPLYQEALEMRKRLLGAEHPYVALSLNNLAGLYDDQGRYSDAEPLYQEALHLLEQNLGLNHASTKVVRENLQALRNQQNQ